jgi:hypothetical protein
MTSTVCYSVNTEHNWRTSELTVLMNLLLVASKNSSFHFYLLEMSNPMFYLLINAFHFHFKVGRCMQESLKMFDSEQA